MANVVTYQELKEHTKKDNLYLLLHSKVYKIGQFIDEHPGGDEVLLGEGGKDATEAFEDVGHSDEARALLADLFVGEFEQNSELKIKSVPVKKADTTVSTAVEKGSNLSYFIPLALLGAYFGWRFYSTGSA